LITLMRSMLNKSKLILIFSHHKFKVDEMDDTNYNDSNFWKRRNSLSMEEATAILKDLEL
jgi:hypothetical protein